MIICEETQTMNFHDELKTNWFYSLQFKAAAQLQNHNLLCNDCDSFWHCSLPGSYCVSPFALCSWKWNFWTTVSTSNTTGIAAFWGTKAESLRQKTPHSNPLQIWSLSSLGISSVEKETEDKEVRVSVDNVIVLFFFFSRIYRYGSNCKHLTNQCNRHTISQMWVSKLVNTRNWNMLETGY